MEKFLLNENELKKAKDFKKRMEKKYSYEEKYCGAVGGFYTFCFTPTGIGTVVVIKTELGDEENITDFELFG